MKSGIAAVAFLLLLCAACSRLTAKNYDRIKVGMTYGEVQSLLGAPTQCTDLLGMKNCVWGDERRSVSVNFVGDKAVLFSSKNLR